MALVHGLVLAAGLSSRMAPHNKLLLPGPGGVPMVASVVRAVCASRVSGVTVVVGHQAAEVESAVRAHVHGPPPRFVVAEDYHMGLAASLKTGIAALPADIAAVIVCLGDMPLVGPELIDRLLAAYAPAEERGIVVPTWRGRRGNPVLWDRRYFADILGLAGDTGARGLMQRHANQVAEIDAGTDAVVRDFDSPETLNTLRDPTG